MCSEISGRDGPTFSYHKFIFRNIIPNKRIFFTLRYYYYSSEKLWNHYFIQAFSIILFIIIFNKLFCLLIRVTDRCPVSTTIKYVSLYNMVCIYSFYWRRMLFMESMYSVECRRESIDHCWSLSVRWSA